MNHWLVKTEPSTYSWDDLVREKTASWTGVRNFSARIHLRAMKKGDRVFIYHSMEEKAIKGIAEVVKEAYPDLTAEDGDWVTVDLKAIEATKNISLAEIKKNPRLTQMVLVNNSRLSVQPVSLKEWKELNKPVK
jgi:predicted RNA-binding protein with PUA-like domain